MSALGVPDADIMKLGGWQSDHVMKSIYRNSMMEKEKKRKGKQPISLVRFYFHDKLMTKNDINAMNIVFIP